MVLKISFPNSTKSFVMRHNINEFLALFGDKKCQKFCHNNIIYFKKIDICLVQINAII